VASEPARTAGSIKLGEDYELDRSAYELRRSGRALKLERIPMELLLLLVEQRGQLVPRDQILTRIWGQNVCLDADNSINAAVRKLRQALRDDPEQPRFIQTVTGKGYRFVAAVSESSMPAAPAQRLIDPQLSSPYQPEKEPPSPRQANKRPIFRERKWAVALVVGALLFALAGWQWSEFRARSSQANRRVMVAVLPFENLTGDPAQEYFSDGLTEEMISQLGNLDPQSLGVIARTSVMHYKNSTEPLDQIARKLQVQYVLEGSVRRDSEKMRITVQLISTSDQTHVWAREYDRQLRDLLILQDEIAGKVAAEIRSTLGKSGSIAKTSAPVSLSSQQLEAHDLYLKGQYFWNKRTAEGLNQAIACFQKAIDRDPGSARAYSGLADSYALLSGYDSSIPAQETIPKARAAAMRAAELDPSLPEVHTALAVIAQDYDWDWHTAEREYRRAIELNDNYATAHHWYGEYLALQGRFDEALREIDRALQLDPLSLIIASDRGVILYYSRQYDRAQEQLLSVLDLEPNFPRTHLLIEVYTQEGRFKDAIADLQRWQSADPDNPWVVATAAYAYGRAGDSQRAEHAMEKLKRIDAREHVDPATFLFGYAGMGDKDQAILWLQKAYATRSTSLISLKVSPLFDNLRPDPRFQDVLHRMGLVPQQDGRSNP
jgi:TolB-like protein/DNA-binding winged helix-turn-helix (wHTH) protein/Tfp pilus assembly protein PilF